jgi:nucleotide-binding universal stress UspA family protein
VDFAMKRKKTNQSSVLNSLGAILVPLDGSDASRPVADTATCLAQKYGARVILLHVDPIEPGMLGYGPAARKERQVLAEISSDQMLFEIAEDIRSQGVEVEHIEDCGNPVRVIVKTAERLGVGLIVIGSHGHGSFYHLLAPSVSEGVLKNAPCPVMVVRSNMEAVKSTVNA